MVLCNLRVLCNVLYIVCNQCFYIVEGGSILVCLLTLQPLVSAWTHSKAEAEISQEHLQGVYLPSSMYDPRSVSMRCKAHPGYQNCAARWSGRAVCEDHTPRGYRILRGTCDRILKAGPEAFC